MKRSKQQVPRRWGAAVIVVLGLLCMPLLAQAAMPPLSGGIGVENRKPHPRYPLKLIFATRKGAYLSGVHVTLYDASGKKVTQATAKGPWLYLDVPAGKYKVVAMDKKVGQSAHVEVTGSEQVTVHLTWKATS